MKPVIPECNIGYSMPDEDKVTYGRGWKPLNVSKCYFCNQAFYGMCSGIMHPPQKKFKKKLVIEE